MRKILLLTAIAAATALPTSANAQARGGLILIDTANILSNCTACKAAQTQLEQRQTALRSRVQTLTQQLRECERTKNDLGLQLLAAQAPTRPLQTRQGPHASEGGATPRA